VVVRGDAAQLHQVLANLLSNARKHTEPGTKVVTGVMRSADGSAVVTVTDNGSGIAPEFVGRVFARFARADASRTNPAAGSAASSAGSPVPATAGARSGPAARGASGSSAGPLSGSVSGRSRGAAGSNGSGHATAPAPTSEGTSGLGLSIVQSIVEAHGGTVEVTSRPGRTEFAVRLPAEPPST
jgi:two-component system OmpR family sensor kinase